MSTKALYTSQYFEFEIEVKFYYTPGYAGSFHEPSYPSEVEIDEILICGVIAPPEIFNNLLKKYKEKIIESCFDHINEINDSWEEERAA